MFHVFQNINFLVFSIFSPLEVIARHFGPKIRIPHPKITPWVEFSGLETDFLVRKYENQKK